MVSLSSMMRTRAIAGRIRQALAGRAIAIPARLGARRGSRSGAQRSHTLPHCARRPPPELLAAPRQQASPLRSGTHSRLTVGGEANHYRSVERRSHARQLSCIPASFSRNGEEIAFIRDVSVSGARLYVRTKLEVGDTVTLNLYLGLSDDARPATGRVVRVDAGQAADSDVWVWEVGVEFDPPITAYAAEIEELARRQLEVGTLRR
jgi:hypothetical protein